MTAWFSSCSYIFILVLLFPIAKQMDICRATCLRSTLICPYSVIFHEPRTYLSLVSLRILNYSPSGYFHPKIRHTKQIFTAVHKWYSLILLLNQIRLPWSVLMHHIYKIHFLYYQGLEEVAESVIFFFHYSTWS